MSKRKHTHTLKKFEEWQMMLNGKGFYIALSFERRNIYLNDILGLFTYLLECCTLLSLLYPQS